MRYLSLPFFLLVVLMSVPFGSHAETVVPMAGSPGNTTNASAGGTVDRRTAPVEIQSQKMAADPAQGTARFEGDVVARQQDLTLYCQELTVYYGKDSAGEPQIARLVARHAVRIVQGDRVATGEEAEYDQRRAMVVLRGGAEVRQGKNAVAGDEITLFLDENRSEVKSAGDGRVRAVFFPEPQP